MRAYARTSYANSNYNLLIHFPNVASIVTPVHRGCSETRPDRLINNCIVSAELVHHIQGETAPSASGLIEVSTASHRAQLVMKRRPQADLIISVSSGRSDHNEGTLGQRGHNSRNPARLTTVV